MIKHIKWGCIRILFWTTLIFAISISGLRYALSEMDFYKTDIEALLSQHLGAPVSIESIRGVLNGIRPELALENIEVHSENDNATLVQLQKIYLGFSILTAIRRPLLEAVQISIMGAKLSVTRLESGSIDIKGLPRTDDDKQPTWLMRGKQYRLIDSEIRWHDKKRNAAPLLLKHINVTLNNDANQHQIYIKTDLPESLGKSIQLEMNFSGDIFVPDSVSARLFIQGQDIHLGKFNIGDLPFGFSLTKGNSDFSLWSTWRASQMIEMQGSIRLSNATIQDNEQASFPVDQLNLQLKLQKHQQQWRLAIKNSTLSSKNITAAVAQFSAALEINSAGDLTHLALNCPQLAIEPFSNIILGNKLLPKKLHKQLKAMALQGEVQDLLLFSNPEQETFSINAQLANIKTHPMDDIPGVENLDLYIKGSEQHGLIQINSPQLKFTAPKLFRKTLNFNHALGELHWQHTDVWELSTPLLEINSDYFKTSTKLSLTFPYEGQPAFMDMRNSFDIMDATKVPLFLPTRILDKEIVTWLDQAFLGGHTTQGGILLRGSLADYPFIQAKGVFEVLFDAQDVALHYAPDWHNLQGVAGEVRFFSTSMDININQGHINDSILQNAIVSIDSFSQSDFIDVTGDAKSSLAHAVLFLTESPFKGLVTDIDEVIDIEGSTDVHIDLKVPLGEQALKANITAKIKDARATILPMDLLISDITADFLFTENGVYSQQINATSLGSPIVGELSTNEQAISAKVSGKMAIAQLAKQFPNPMWAYAQGSSDYQAKLEFPNNGPQLCTIELDSNLIGTAIQFSPISKPEAQNHPISIKLGLAPSGINAFKIVYENPVALQNRVDINLKKIAPHWQGLIHTPMASGSIFIPIAFNKDSEISLSLKELDLSAIKKVNLGSNDGAALVVKNLPSIKLSSQELYWNHVNLGKLELQTQPTDQGLSITQCDISSLNNKLSLTGFWQQQNQQNFSSISGNLLSDDFGTFLKKTRLSNDIDDTTADLQFVLNWPAAPYEISKATLSGSIDAHLAYGRILGVDPGLGRVLGALDIWKIGDRLRFDFSDITDSGLSFSETTGHFTINQGTANTKDLMINAMPAKIYISGSTNLLTEEIDLRATVLPKFPIAGTIIGNVTNAVSKTFIGKEQPGGFIVSLLYEIKGRWDDFTINRQFSSSLANDLTHEP